jgi:hypothetical protein
MVIGIYRNKDYLSLRAQDQARDLGLDLLVLSEIVRSLDVTEKTQTKKYQDTARISGLNIILYYVKKNELPYVNELKKTNSKGRIIPKENYNWEG